MAGEGKGCNPGATLWEKVALGWERAQVTDRVSVEPPGLVTMAR